MATSYTADGKDIMLGALKGTNPPSSIQYVGALSADAGKSLTGVSATGVFTSTAHGYSDGNLVILSALTGGTGLVAGRAYYVRDSTTNTFKLTQKSGGTAETFTTDLTVGTITRLVELSGGTYARVATAMGTPANGIMVDSTAHVLNAPAASHVDYEGYYTASTAGTLLALVTPPQSETFTGAGTYTVNTATLDLNAVA